MTKEDREIVENEVKQFEQITGYSRDVYIRFINEVLAKHPFSYFSLLTGKRFAKLWKDVCEKTAFIDEVFKPKPGTRIFYYVRKLDHLLACETDGRAIAKDISPVSPPPHFFCCNRCAQLHESTIAKTKETKFKNHGDSNWNNMEKNRQTCREHFGVDCSWQAEEVKVKSRQSIRDHYGVDHQMQSKEVRDGMKARYREAHGVECSFQNPEVKKKISQTKAENRAHRIEESAAEEKQTTTYEIDVLKQKVLEVIEEHPNSFGRIIKSKNYDPSILASLKHHCPKVADDEYDVQTKIYWLLNGITDFPKCGNASCNNTFEHHNVFSWKTGYRKNCCPQCAKDSDERKELYVQSCQEKYGVDNISQLDATKKKKEEKALEKYGVDCVSKSPEVQKLIQETNVDRYGSTTYLHSDEGVEVLKQRCLERYGVEHYSQTDEYIEKCKATNNKNYGVDWPQKNREFMRSVQKRYTYEGFNFDSKPELAYYIWLKDNSIEFTYQPDLSFEYEHDGMKHVYEPDFIVEGRSVEIKGDHFFKEDGTMQNPYDHSQDGLYEAKHQCMLKNNVKIMRSNEYDAYVTYVEQKYGKDYLQSFKNK